MLYALLHKDKIIGLFSDLKKCNMMQKGLVANNFTTLKNMKIISYYDNSITLYDGVDEEEEDDIIEAFTSEKTTESDNIVSTDKLDSTKQKKLKKQRERKSKIEYNITLLKQQKEKIEESKTVYNTDIELYKKFKKLQNEIPEFIIPELFQKKFILIKQLEEQNNLSWETFHSKYNKDSEIVDTSYNKLFGGSSGKERKLLDLSSSTESNDDSNSEVSSVDNTTTDDNKFDDEKIY